jgi:hypothetical protein
MGTIYTLWTSLPCLVESLATRFSSLSSLNWTMRSDLDAEVEFEVCLLVSFRVPLFCEVLGGLGAEREFLRC